MSTLEWQPVCPVDALEVERGVTALVHGQALAIFRTHDDHVYALGNYDPFAKASVLARGIVGTRGDVPFVASPMHKHAFDLRTGQCLDDSHVRVPAYDVKVVDGVVHVGLEAGRMTAAPAPRLPGRRHRRPQGRRADRAAASGAAPRWSGRPRCRWSRTASTRRRCGPPPSRC